MSNVIGIDLGGTNILAARIDENGRILARQNRATPAGEGGEAVVAALAALAAAARDEDSAAVGVVSPGMIDARRGTFVGEAYNIPGLDRIPIGGRLAEALGLPAFAENDGNAAALAENWIGAAKGAKICVMLTLGTGIGGGVVMGGRIYHGAGYCSGEFGHICIDFQGRKCACGSIGCAEAYASANALAVMGRKAVASSDGTGIEKLIELSRGDTRNLTAKMICDAARDGDGFALGLLDEYARPLAAVLGAVINSLNPDRIVIGGGLSLSWDLIGPKVEKELAVRSLVAARSGCKIVAAALGDEAGVIGAARVAWNQLKSSGISTRL
ncbi:MAG: ROK family protein [Planctomycetota bacterium]